MVQLRVPPSNILISLPLILEGPLKAPEKASDLFSGSEYDLRRPRPLQIDQSPQNTLKRKQSLNLLSLEFIIVWPPSSSSNS